MNAHHVVASNGSLTHTLPLLESMRMRTGSVTFITISAVMPAIIAAGISKS